MITIKKGENTLIVSKAAYKDMFKNLGYAIVDETIATPKEEVVQETKNEDILEIENEEEVVEETKTTKRGSRQDKNKGE